MGFENILYFVDNQLAPHGQLCNGGFFQKVGQKIEA
jgi:hypothetical protein